MQTAFRRCERAGESSGSTTCRTVCRSNRSGIREREQRHRMEAGQQRFRCLARKTHLCPMSRFRVDVDGNAGVGGDGGLDGFLPLSVIQISLGCCWAVVRVQVRREERRVQRQMVVAKDRRRQEGQAVVHPHWAVGPVVRDCCAVTVRQVENWATWVGDLLGKVTRFWDKYFN